MPGPLAIEREVPFRVCRADGVELQPEQLGTELQVVISTIEHHIVVQLEAAIFARHKRAAKFTP